MTNILGGERSKERREAEQKKNKSSRAGPDA